MGKESESSSWMSNWMTPLYDAHCHWADPKLQSCWSDIDEALKRIGISKAVVNGTSPDDWPEVLKMAGQDARVIPAIGLHPWKVSQAHDDWKARFLEALNSGAQVVGEIGLDQWIDDHDIDQQQEAFRFQLELAAQRNLPVSIHCLKATGPLLKTLSQIESPARGIHLHALNAPLEVFQELEKYGAYFSFNSGQLKQNSRKAMEAIKWVPLDRLLIETDAPDFLPLEKYREFTLPEDLNHPANLRNSYAAIAAIRGISSEKLAEIVARNFECFFT